MQLLVQAPIIDRQRVLEPRPQLRSEGQQESVVGNLMTALGVDDLPTGIQAGEGVLGLRRSFLVAGARTLVATLWEVPDLATAVLMERFYENLGDPRHLPPDEALRDARQRWLRTAGAGGSDLARATTLAHVLVEVYGMGGEATGLRVSRSPRDGKRVDGLSPAQEEAIDRQVNALLAEAQARAARILRENRDQLETLRAMLLEKKTIEAKALGGLLPGGTPSPPAAGNGA